MFPQAFLNDRSQAPVLRAVRLVLDNPALPLRAHAFDSLADEYQDVAVFGVRPGDIVADIGCGSGALEFRLLRERVPFQKLYAVDIDARAIRFLRAALHAVGDPMADRVEPVCSTLQDIRVPPASADLVLLSDTPIGVHRPGFSVPASRRDEERVIDSMYAALKPGGRLRFLYHLHAPHTADSLVSALVGAYSQAGFQELPAGRVTTGRMIVLEFRKPVSVSN